MSIALRYEISKRKAHSIKLKYDFGQNSEIPAAVVSQMHRNYRSFHIAGQKVNPKSQR